MTLRDKFSGIFSNGPRKQRFGEASVAMGQDLIAMRCLCWKAGNRQPSADSKLKEKPMHSGVDVPQIRLSLTFFHSKYVLSANVPRSPRTTNIRLVEDRPSKTNRSSFNTPEAPAGPPAARRRLCANGGRKRPVRNPTPPSTDSACNATTDLCKSSYVHSLHMIFERLLLCMTRFKYVSVLHTRTYTHDMI